MRSGSGATCSPCTHVSSAVLAITARSEPTSSCIPAASFAPPVPPASSTTRISGPDRRAGVRRASGWPLSPVVFGPEPGDPDPGAGLVAGVDRDQKRRELLDDSRGLERAGVHRSQARDRLDDLRHPRLVGLAVAADEHVLVELRV